MQLADWMEKHDLLDREFADEIGVRRATVSRFRSGALIPSFTLMIRIYEATDGAVAPNDFLPRDVVLAAKSARGRRAA